PAIYTLSLHDALPISVGLSPVVEVVIEGNRLDAAIPGLEGGRAADGGEPQWPAHDVGERVAVGVGVVGDGLPVRRLDEGDGAARSEEHTSELQSPCNL